MASTQRPTPRSKKKQARGVVPVLFKNPLFLSLSLIAIYFLLAFAAYWPAYPGDPSRVVGCACGDAAQSAWFLRWTPYAIAHGQNPLFTNFINIPYGANLAQNTLMPLLGIITWPLTALAGPIASFNLLAWLAFPLSASSIFYVSRKLQFSRLAAFAAGLLFGFSPYMVGQGEGHIMLTFVPLLPLMLYASWQLLVEQKSMHPYKIGLILALEVISQFFIDPEILAIFGLAAAIGATMLAVFRWREITRHRIKYAVRGFAVTCLLSFAVLIYPVWLMTSGPRHFVGPNFGPGNPYRSDLIGLVVPMQNQRITLPTFHHYAASTDMGDYSEVGDYIGIVLLAVIIAGLIKWRHSTWLIFCSASALLIWIGSLGPRLVINTHKTPIIMPFAVATKIPLIRDLLPSRLSLAEWFFVAIAIALIIQEWQASKKAKSKKESRSRTWVPIAVGLLVIVTLLPRWPYPTVNIHKPSYFKGGATSISGDKVLAYPLPIYSDDRFMLWQADSNMNFKIVASYIANPSLKGTSTELPPLLDPPNVEQWLAFEESGQVSPDWKQISSVSSADISKFLQENHIDAVVIDPHYCAILTSSNRLFRRSLHFSKQAGGELVKANARKQL